MSDTRPILPHFLRVARALARVRSVAGPLAITTVVAGAYSGCSDGEPGMHESTTSGTGGKTTTSSAASYGGEQNGFTVMDAGYDGAPVGDMVMPDAGSDGG